MSTLDHEKSIKAWIGLVSGLSTQNIFLSNESGPRPDTDFITFQCLFEEMASSAWKDREVEEPNPDGLVSEIFVHRTFLTYQIDAYSSNGRNILNKLWLSRNIKPLRKNLKVGGLTLSTKSVIRNLTALEDTSFASRFSMDVKLLAEREINSSDIGYDNKTIEDFEIGGTLKED